MMGFRFRIYARFLCQNRKMAAPSADSLVPNAILELFLRVRLAHVPLSLSCCRVHFVDFPPPFSSSSSWPDSRTSDKDRQTTILLIIAVSVCLVFLPPPPSSYRQRCRPFELFSGLASRRRSPPPPPRLARPFRSDPSTRRDVRSSSPSSTCPPCLPP